MNDTSAASAPSRSSQLTFPKALVVVLVSALAFAAFGGTIGFTIANLAPGYYRAVFRGGNEPHFDPVAVGCGLGVTQGAGGGVVVGLFLVAVLAWRDARRHAPGPTSAIHIPTPGSSLVNLLAWIAGVLVVSAVCFAIGGGLGMLVGERDAANRRYQEECNAVTPVLASDPAFARVGICEYSGGGVCLVGTLASEGDFERLRSRVIRAIGERRARFALTGVHVRP